MGVPYSPISARLLSFEDSFIHPVRLRGAPVTECMNLGVCPCRQQGQQIADGFLRSWDTAGGGGGGGADSRRQNVRGRALGSLAPAYLGQWALSQHVILRVGGPLASGTYFLIHTAHIAIRVESQRQVVRLCVCVCVTVCMSVRMSICMCLFAGAGCECVQA